MKPWKRRNLSTEARATLVTKALWPDASGPQPYILEALEAEAEERENCFGCRTVVPDLDQRYNRFLNETIRLKSELDLALGKIRGMEEGGEILRRERDAALARVQHECSLRIAAEQRTLRAEAALGKAIDALEALDLLMDFGDPIDVSLPDVITIEASEHLAEAHMKAAVVLETHRARAVLGKEGE